MQNRSNAQKQADKWFSLYIRLRDADQYGRVTCCTTGKLMMWNQCDAGHWISRRYQCTRYDERNVHPQSKASNRFHGGDQEAHRRYIAQRYGENIPDELYMKSKMTCKRSISDFQYLISTYKEKARYEANLRGIKI